MILFSIINIVMISCGSGGAASKDGQAAKADGTVIDLVKVSKKIKDAVEFAASVKEVETLVKSVDELVKAIGKKIKNDDEGFDTEANKNGSLLAGILQLMFAVGTKLEVLEKTAEISNELNGKVTASKSENTALITRLKGGDDSLGKSYASDTDTKNAIDKNDNTGGKGRKEIVKLNTAVDALLKSAQDAVLAAVAKLTISTKADPAKP
uniref:Vsp4 n=1 Tax=Borrelia miyamotoi TaxID=47466 RepID=A0A0X9K8G9_9SPIR|nr:Vsp4 [Borrelia miyamotoi]